MLQCCTINTAPFFLIPFQISSSVVESKWTQNLCLILYPHAYTFTHKLHFIGIWIKQHQPYWRHCWKVSEPGQICLSRQQGWFAGKLMIWTGASLWWRVVGDSTRECKSLSWRATYMSGHWGSLLLLSAASVSLHIPARIPNTPHSSLLSKSYFKQQIPVLGFQFSLLHSCLHRPYGLSPSPRKR